MKNTLSLRQCCLAFIAILNFTLLYGQDYSLEQERYKAMLAEEEKIAQFISEHIDDDIPKEVYDLNAQFDEKYGVEHKHDTELPPEQREGVELGKKRLYLRSLYFREFPEARKIFQSILLEPCLNGNFELGDYTGLEAFSGTFDDGDCDLTGINFVQETPGTIESGVTLNPGINCEIMDVGPDSIVNHYGGTLQRVHTGDHSLRVNQDHDRYGINKVHYPVVLTQTNETIAFWYTFVLQNPDDHDDEQPFFRATALDQSGTELDNFCETALQRNNFTTAVPTNTSDDSLVWTVWRCAELEVSGDVGDTIILDVTTSDCGQGAHWGYSYIDDICTECTIDPCNYQGSIDLDPTDTCSEITEVCGTYELAAFNCNTATVDNISLDIYQNGSSIGTINNPVIDLVNQTFCFTISPGDFTGYTGGFDFQANITFNINGQFNTESDLNTNPGPDNDYVTDPECCPEFRVMDCCEYWDLSARGEEVDRRITERITEYREKLRERHGSWVDTVGCSPCLFPDDPFPVFIVDENNMLIDDSYYNINWSHNPGWTAAFDWILPEQPTTVTVADPTSECVWTEDFYYDCCEFEAEITPLCTTCDPCSDPGQPFFLIVNDQNGNPLSTSGYSFIWSTGSASSGINGTVNNEYWVTVTEEETGCVSTDTFEIACCSCDVTAKFDYEVGGCDVRFTNHSAAGSCSEIVDYMWSFGDGTTSSAAHPTHTYNANGVYEVCLITTAYDGTDRCMDTVCQRVEIRECETCPCELKPEMDFTIDKCEVQFEGNPGNNSCTRVDKYIWDFGDGTTYSTLQNPVHTYAANGTYQVCLTVEGNNGKVKCKEKICKTIEIRECEDCVCDIESNFTAMMSRLNPCEVFFNEAVVTSECTNISSYHWNFGDGTTSNAANPSHIFPGNGTYHVCLRVHGVNGRERCADEYCRRISIRNCGIILPGETEPSSSGSLNDFDASVFPNPFNNELTIQFVNPHEQNVEIALLNMDGKQIAEISNETRAKGAQDVSFSGSELNLAEGVYFIVIRSESLLTYKKVVFNK